jgi:hypothetical protein
VRGSFAGRLAPLARGIAEWLDPAALRGFVYATDDPSAVVPICDGKGRVGDVVGLDV